MSSIKSIAVTVLLACALPLSALAEPIPSSKSSNTTSKTTTTQRTTTSTTTKLAIKTTTTTTIAGAITTTKATTLVNNTTTTKATTFVTTTKKSPSGTSTTTTSAKPNATKCPRYFAIQMKANDNSTWYFRTPEIDGVSAELTTDPTFATSYYIQNSKLYLDTDTVEDVYANHQVGPNSSDFIFFASQAAKVARNETQSLRPIVAAVDKQCGVSLTFEDKKYLQRYARRVFLTSQPTGGQLQFSDARAIEPVDLEDDQQ